MRLYLVLAVSISLVACSQASSNNDDNDNNIVVINNQNSSANNTQNSSANAATNSSSDPRCQDMIDGINASGGTACPDGSCDPIPCACADGSVVNTSSCLNGVCAGLEACESACGEVLSCGISGGNNGMNGSTNGSTNNPLNNNNLGGPDDEGMQGDDCTCDDNADPDEDRYKICYGTEDGCDGAFGDPLECVWNLRADSGVCRAGCTEDDYLQQGPCPAGTICDRFPSLIHDELNPNYFYACQ
jgi:hypothetical protein